MLFANLTALYNLYDLAHLEHAQCFAVLTMLVEADGPDGDERERNFLRLLDETTFERVASYELMAQEAACSTRPSLSGQGRGPDTC